MDGRLFTQTREPAMQSLTPVLIVDNVSPRRSTFYGMDEIIVREPGGNVVTFAERTGDGKQ